VLFLGEISCILATTEHATDAVTRIDFLEGGRERPVMRMVGSWLSPAAWLAGLVSSGRL